MFETFTMTQILSVFLGLYFLSVGVGIVLEREKMPSMIQHFGDNIALGFMGGILAFIVGAIIVSLHQDYSSAHGTVVSIIGWITLAKGVLILAFRSLFIRLASNVFNSTTVAGFAGIVAMLIGLWMMSAI